jgi:hypothetical protein
MLLRQIGAPCSQLLPSAWRGSVDRALASGICDDPGRPDPARRSHVGFACGRDVTTRVVRHWPTPEALRRGWRDGSTVIIANRRARHLDCKRWMTKACLHGPGEMPMVCKLLATAVVAAGAISLASQAPAVPIAAPSSLEDATAPLAQPVQWWGWGPYPYYSYYGAGYSFGQGYGWNPAGAAPAPGYSRLSGRRRRYRAMHGALSLLRSSLGHVSRPRSPAPPLSLNPDDARCCGRAVTPRKKERMRSFFRFLLLQARGRGLPGARSAPFERGFRRSNGLG